MTEWFAMGGYGVYVWPSFAVFLASLLGGWVWSAWSAARIRERIRQQWTQNAS